MNRVMIVEDEHLIRKGIVNSISWEKLGFLMPAQASNGKEALYKMKNDPPDVLITDIKMPVLDGLDLIENVNKFYPNTKIIILSGYGDFSYAQKAIKLGVYAYILKPVNEQEVNELLYKLSYDLEANENKNNSLNSNNRILCENEFEFIEHNLLKLISCSYSDVDKCRKRICDIWNGFPEDSMCVAACSINTLGHGDTKDEDLYKKVYSEVKAYWKKFKFPVLSKDKNLYIVFYNHNAIMKYDILIKIKHFQNDIEEYFKKELCEEINICCGIGNTYKGLGNLYNSCKEADIALKFKFFNGISSIDSIIDYNQISNKRFRNPNYIAIKEASNALVDAVLEADIPKAMKLTDKFLESLLLANFYDEDLIILKCIDLFKELERNLKSERIDNYETIDGIILKDITTCKLYSELCAYFKKHIISIVNAINEYKNSMENRLTFKIKQYIDENYNLRLSLKDISDVFHKNPSYISSSFKDITGVNITDYILNVRLLNAKKLLKDSDMQVLEIAEKVGFSDYRYFCTVFKKEINMTPLQFRYKLLA